jgi:Uma2 family endonuclease
MVVQTTKRATLDDLYAVEGKAELIGGRIVQTMGSGDLPTDVALNITVSLRAHSKAIKRGVAKGDGVGYAIPELPSGRESFSPDASYYDGPRPRNRMRFIEGPPNFGAEVRSENDYGPAAEMAMSDKRDDYFAAGTLVVWDVDPFAETIAKYTHDAPDKPTVFKRGEIADAEPAVPGWRIPVDEVDANLGRGSGVFDVSYRTRGFRFRL